MCKKTEQTLFRIANGSETTKNVAQHSATDILTIKIIRHTHPS
jgi:hypothetical protein